MTFPAALVLLAWVGFAPPQEEPLYRERVEKFLLALEGDDKKEAEVAAREIGMLPSSLIPMIVELAPEDKRPRAAAKLKELMAPAPWRRLFKNSIESGRGHYHAIYKDASFHRTRSVNEAIRGLACIPAEEAKAILDGFAAGEDPVAKDFAASAILMLRPKDKGPFVKLLDSPVSCDRAADLVILAGETAALPKAVEIFCRQERPESAAAAKVLEAFGAEGFVDQIAAVLEAERPLFFQEAVRILGRTGGKAAVKALVDALGRLKPGDRKAGALVHQLDALHGGNSDIRELLAQHKSAPSDREAQRGSEEGLSPKERLAKIRSDKSGIGPIQLKQLYRYASPELKDDVLAWAQDPAATANELQYLLPLLGAVGGRDCAPLLLEKLKSKPFASTGAADGLAMIGDPAHAREVWKASMSGGVIFGTSMVSFPPEALEEELVAHFKEADHVSPRALQLARLRPTPAIRQAMFDRLEKSDARTLTWWEIPIFLEKGRDEKEREAIVRIRRSDRHIVQMIGHFLAMRGGDAAAADALAEMLAKHDTFTFRDPRSAHYWRECEKGGQVWREAVERVWKNKPDWGEGLLELARWGDPATLEHLKTELKKPTLQYRDGALQVLAGRNEPAAVEWFLGRLIRSNTVWGADEDVAKRLMEISSFRERLLVMARCAGTDGGGWALALLAEREEPDALPLHRIAANRGIAASLRALVRFKDPDAYRLSIRLLRSGASGQRRTAAQALQEIGNRAAVPHLAGLVDDMEEAWDARIERADPRIFETPPPGKVAEAAMAALEKLTGVKAEGATIFDRRDFWRNWVAKNLADWK